MPKVLARFAVFFFVLFHSGKAFSADSVYVFKEAHIKLNIPNSHWHLQPMQEKNGFTVYVFKRDPVLDSSNRNIIPNAAVVIEKISPKTDVVTFSVNKRANAAFSVTKMYTYEDRTINYRNAVACKGAYTDDYALDHTVYVVHAIHDDKGVQIILDTTTETLPEIEAEFLQILKSIANQNTN